LELLSEIFGQGEDLSALQMCCRAVVIFIIALLLIRISGRRSFGMQSPFDNTIVILLGAILSRTVVGASEFIPTVSASLVIALMHRIFAWIGIRNKRFNRLIKGRKITLYKDGKLLDKSLERALVNEDDLTESVRTNLHEEGLDKIETAYMERSGKINVIKKKSG
jgi:uncharacterized membrane protein YcaP (DUF421 family)